MGGTRVVNLNYFLLCTCCRTRGAKALGLLLQLLAVALLSTPAKASYSNYDWAEIEKSWWSYTTTSTSTSNMRFQDMEISSTGDAIYVLGTKSKTAPPGVAPWDTCEDHVFILAFDILTGLILQGTSLIGNDGCKADIAYDIQLAPAVSGQPTNIDVVYVVGYTGSKVSTSGAGFQGGLDMYLARFSIDTSSSFSNAIVKNWVTQVGSASDDIAYSVAVSSSGTDIYVTGITKGTLEPGVIANADSTGATYDMFLVKFSSSGAVVWQSMMTSASDSPNTAAEDIATRVAVAASGDVYVTGRTKGNSLASGATVTSQGNYDWTLTKVSGSDGSVSWNRQLDGTYNSIRDDDATGLFVTSSNEIIVSGTFGGDGTTPVRTFVAKLDSSGNAIYFKGLTKAPDVAWGDANSINEFSATNIIEDPAVSGNYLFGGSAEYQNTSYTSKDAVHSKAFSDGSSASTTTASSEAFITSQNFMPQSFLANGYPEATFTTGVALKNTFMFVCGYTKYPGQLPNVNDALYAPFLMKLVPAPPPRKYHHMQCSKTD